MSTIKSSDEHLTLNADGSGNDIKFQSNGSEVASISDGGVVTATSFAGSGANLTNLPADSTKLPLAGGTMTGNLSFSNADPTISNSSGNLKISSEDSLVLEMDNNSTNTGGEKIYFRTDATTTAMQIGEDGDIEIGDTHSSLRYARLNLKNKSGTTSIMTGQLSSNGGAFADFYNSSQGHIGAIRLNASATAYETSSDYRLKENVDYDWDATTRLKQLKPARFNFIADDTNTLVDGFLAHEVSDIVPEAISGTKDAVDEDNNPKYQGIDQAKLVPLLVKTIQELEARITELENA